MMKFLISQVIKSFEVQRASQKILLRTTEPYIHMLRFRKANRSELFT